MDKKITISQEKYSSTWPLKMAWRESRKSRGKLLLFIASISLGIAALVGITSFRENLLEEIDEQAKSLLGADFSVSGNKVLPDSLFSKFAAISSSQSKETFFSSMVLFHGGGTRLTQVRALAGDYPYYGEIETVPVNAAKEFRGGRHAIVDEKLTIQYNVGIGDSVKVGDVSFEIVGKVRKIPGQSTVGTTVAPVVYIPAQYLDATGLVMKGSRINRTAYFQFDPSKDTTGVWTDIKEQAEGIGFDVDTIEDKKDETGRAFKDLSAFLELIAFTALLLGCLGVASSIYVYVKSKVQAVSVLRCLGMKASQAINIYLLQVAFFGLIGSVIGCIIGVAIHLYLPEVTKSFIPIDITPKIYWPAIYVGVLMGVVISVLFGLLSLVGLRKISPLSAIRVGFESTKIKWDKLVALIGLMVVAFIFFALWWQLKDPFYALVYTAVLIGSIFLLFGIGKGLSWGMKRVLPTSLSFVWRQGMSNLYRPNNQTVVLVTTLGLSTALLAMLYFMQDLLVQRVSMAGENERPNTVLFDIQSDQRDKLHEMTRDYSLPIMQDVPIVTMRLLEVNGKNKNEAWNDSTARVPGWAFNREYRVTYRDSLISSETLVMGEWTGEVQNATDSIFISLSEGYAENLNVGIGDELTFNVQGAVVKTYVGSFREIDWRRVQTNFLVLFPEGVLEKAPQFHVLITRIDQSELSAMYQQAVVQQFPNISIIDLELILKTLEDVLGKVAFVIQFMALFSIGTGLVVMISAIILSRFQRMQENVLLRTIGATKNQLWKIIAAEYFFLGGLGAIAGLALATFFTGLLGAFVFEFTFIPDLIQIVVIFFVVTFCSVIIGLLNSRNIIRHSPLEVLRNEL
ncbi:MAG: FtsX-like permease family protein [Cyclobacteriaceae bacterium]